MRGLVRKLRWPVFLSLLVLSGCPCEDPDHCADICACIDGFFEDNPDADMGLTFCKPQCESQATDHDSCVDFVAGRTSPEYTEQLQMECAAPSCHAIGATEEE